jgi:hypothetical protein
MNRRRIPASSANPLLLWTNLALKTSEMLMASAQVIGHRTQRMALAGPMPNARDRREFTLMGQEKVDAVGESMQAVALRMVTANQQLGAMLFKQMMAGATSFMALATTPALAWTGLRQSELLGQTVSSSTALASHLSGSFAQLAHHGLKPIHSRATSNARRLLKIR